MTDIRNLEPREPRFQEPDSASSAGSSVLEAANDYSKYAVHSRTEIVYILRAMKESGALITVSFNKERDFLLTTLLDVAADGGTMMLDLGGSAEMNQRALTAEKLICTSKLDKIKIQFTLSGVQRVSFDGGDAFAATIPDSLVRLQRREHYRMIAPLSKRLICHIPLPSGPTHGTPEDLELGVIDISASGVALMVPADNDNFRIGTEFFDCRIDLNDIGSVAAPLRVRNVHEITLTNGKTLTRSGCAFVKPPRTAVRLVQRYIMQAERERRHLPMA